MSGCVGSAGSGISWKDARYNLKHNQEDGKVYNTVSDALKPELKADADGIVDIKFGTAFLDYATAVQELSKDPNIQKMDKMELVNKINAAQDNPFPDVNCIKAGKRLDLSQFIEPPPAKEPEKDADSKCESEPKAPPEPEQEPDSKCESKPKASPEPEKDTDSKCESEPKAPPESEPEACDKPKPKKTKCKPKTHKPTHEPGGNQCPPPQSSGPQMPMDVTINYNIFFLPPQQGQDQSSQVSQQESGQLPQQAIPMYDGSNNTAEASYYAGY